MNKSNHIFPHISVDIWVFTSKSDMLKLRRKSTLWWKELQFEDFFNAAHVSVQGQQQLPHDQKRGKGMIRTEMDQNNWPAADNKKVNNSERAASILSFQPINSFG